MGEKSGSWKVTFLFQQDSAPAHKAKKVQDFLSAAVPRFLTCKTFKLPRPEPIGLLLLRGTGEAGLHCPPFQYQEAKGLHQASGCQDVMPRMSSRAAMFFLTRIEAVMRAEGSHIE